jgi:phospholipase D1/2
MSLAALAHEIAKHGEIPNGSAKPTNEDDPNDDPDKSAAQPSHAQNFLKNFVLDTPSTRTGPPRSLSFAYSLSNSPPRSRNNSHQVEGDSNIPFATEEDSYFSPAPGSVFRGALEHGTPNGDSKGKKRESKNIEESWNLNPIRWFQESPKVSPKEEKAGFDFTQAKTNGSVPHRLAESTPASPRDSPKVEEKEIRSHHKSATGDERSLMPKFGLKRSSSVPHGNSTTPSTPLESKHRAKWGRLRSLIPQIISQERDAEHNEERSAVVNKNVNITDELIAGGLSTLMLRLWFERDEKNHRRVPVLLHRLRIRISDSLHAMHGSKAVFRVECEYANGAARWVIYRELRDFWSLHTHYVASNAYNRNVDNMPEFPKTSASLNPYVLLFYDSKQP